jgi:hypothetical protein
LTGKPRKPWKGKEEQGKVKEKEGKLFREASLPYGSGQKPRGVEGGGWRGLTGTRNGEGGRKGKKKMASNTEKTNE